MRAFHKIVLLVWVLTCSIFLMVKFGRYGLIIDSRGLLSYSQPSTTQEQTPSILNGPAEAIIHSLSQPRPLPQLIPASSADFQNVPVVLHLPPDDGSHITELEIQEYIDSIWDLNNDRFWRAECDTQYHFPPRYHGLRQLGIDHTSSKVKYFFALDLYEVRSLLPRLMGTLVQVIKMLGHEKCAISIVEGRSRDGTYAILSALKDKLEEAGAKVWLSQSNINPRGPGVDRIGALSELRNMALRPLTHTEEMKSTGLFAMDTTTLFLNDIALCTDDIYELLFQHHHQGADQTCAMDWTFGGNLFYDSWVSRSMSGDLFFEVPSDVSFAYAESLFWDHQHTREKWHNHQAFQVYSCWGGMVVLNSKPFIGGTIEFRNSSQEECYASEPHNLAKDLWRQGYGKIQTVPTVNVGYNSFETNRIKKRRGHVNEYVDIGMPIERERHLPQVSEQQRIRRKTEKIEWKAKPPGQVKCMPDWGITWWTDP